MLERGEALVDGPPDVLGALLEAADLLAQIHLAGGGELLELGDLVFELEQGLLELQGNGALLDLRHAGSNSSPLRACGRDAGR
ncbi:hypothetical protein D3C87_2089320 [compost metagenome]